MREDKGIGGKRKGEVRKRREKKEEREEEQNEGNRRGKSEKDGDETERERQVVSSHTCLIFNLFTS